MKLKIVPVVLSLMLSASVVQAEEKLGQYSLPSQVFGWGTGSYKLGTPDGSTFTARIKIAEAAVVAETRKASDALSKVVGRPVTLADDCYTDLACFQTVQLNNLVPDYNQQEFEASLAGADRAVFLLLPILSRLDRNVEAAIQSGDTYRAVDVMMERDQIMRAPYAATLGGTPFSDKDVSLVTLWIRSAVRGRDIANAKYVLDTARSLSPSDRQKFLIHTWLIAQHADRTPELQYMALQAMKDAPAGAIDGSELAMMTDRFQLTVGESQVYGTQTECREGHWQLSPLSSPERLNERRRKLGLAPLDQGKTGDACDF